MLGTDRLLTERQWLNHIHNLVRLWMMDSAGIRDNIELLRSSISPYWEVVAAYDHHCAWSWAGNVRNAPPEIDAFPTTSLFDKCQVLLSILYGNFCESLDGIAKAPLTTAPTQDMFEFGLLMALTDERERPASWYSDKRIMPDRERPETWYRGTNISEQEFFAMPIDKRIRSGYYLVQLAEITWVCWQGHKVLEWAYTRPDLYSDFNAILKYHPACLSEVSSSAESNALDKAYCAFVVDFVSGNVGLNELPGKFDFLLRMHDFKESVALEAWEFPSFHLGVHGCEYWIYIHDNPIVNNELYRELLHVDKN